MIVMCVSECIKDAQCIGMHVCLCVWRGGG